MSSRLLFAMGTALALSGPLAAQDRTADDVFAQDDILGIMHKVNDYTRANPYRETDRNWIRATWYSGVMEAYHATGDPAYLKQAKDWAQEHQYQVGHEKSGFNRLFCTMTWAELNLLDPDPKKIATTIAALKEKVPYSPAGAKVWYGHAPGPWDKPVYADSLYGAPVLAMLHKATGDRQYLDILNGAFWDVTAKIYDRDEDLFYRDPSYIGKTSPNGGKILWSRGNGWVFGGLARVIKHLPKDDPSYKRYVDIYRRMAKSLASRQGDDGFWRSNLGDPQHYTMPESSGTAFFTAGFAWGVREGILDRDAYLPVIIRGWNALVSAVHPSGRLGWVQPVDGQPRPSHPRTTQEYAVGPFLTAAGQVCLLVKDGIITPEKIRAALPEQSQLLPPAAVKDGSLTNRGHPLSEQINAFLKNQQGQPLSPTNFKKKDYLDVIARQVKAMRQYQNAAGRIIDPVEKTEKFFTTPCYAHSIAVLAKAGYPIEKDVIESGMKALDVSLADMAAGKAPGSHGDFFTWPIVLAYELFEASASSQRRQAWKRHLKQIDPRRYRVYREPLSPSDHRGFYKTYASHFANNWNLVNVAGEWGRVKHGLADPWYVDYCMTMQLPNFSPYGMYNESGNPLPYDLFSRHYLTGMLQRGYRSFLYTTYRDILWRGAWTSLFMQSPFGELPTGYRSSHHIWNEAEQAVIFEIYASAYAKAGRKAEAGAFKRAAHLSLISIRGWIRPDGSGFIVKNRYPIKAKHGYEDYSVHTCYNMLAMSMLAQAWQFANDEIAEKPCPADVGGFAFTVPRFHKVFANAGGNYVEYDTAGDHKYNPTGILRVHLRDGHPQLGPSDGCAAKFSGNGVNLAVGPAWRINGEWRKLADSQGKTPNLTVLEETPQRVRFKAAYRGASQTVTVDETGITVEDVITTDGVDAIRVYYPMLVFDGKDQTEVVMDKNAVKLALNGRSVNFTVIEPKGLTLQRSGKELRHRNGMVEPVFAESTGQRLVYRITTGRSDELVGPRPVSATKEHSRKFTTATSLSAGSTLHKISQNVSQAEPAAYPYDTARRLNLSGTFKRFKAPGTGRDAVQLTSGQGFCYPLYYFIPSLTKDFKHLIYHRADGAGVQLYRLNLTTDESIQLTTANVEDSGWYPWDAPNPGRGVLDHRSVLNVAMNKVIYFTGRDGRKVRVVDVSTLDDQLLFEIPEGREAIGQNCCTPDGKWFVYIHAPRGSRKPKPCKGAVLAAYSLETKEHRVLTVIDSAIHHVQPYGNRRFVFCHTPSGNGMMMATLDGDPWMHLRDGDPGTKGRVCHHVTTTAGIAFEASGHISGLYDPMTKERFEFQLPKEWGYTHTGWDPEGRLWFWEAARQHHLTYLKHFDQHEKPVFEKLTGEWRTYGRGQKSHFHPQITPDRNWILFVCGDDETKSNHIFLLDVSDLKGTQAVSKEMLGETGDNQVE